MKRRYLIQGALAAGVCSLSGVRTTYAKDEGGIALLMRFVKEVERAEGAFEQTIYGKDGKKLDGPLRGVFAFQRPGRFVWEVKIPYPQKIVSDSKTIYIWDPDLNQVTVKRLSAAISSTPASILFGEGDIEKSFKLEELPETEGCRWVRAMPKVEDLTYASIDLGFDSRGYVTDLKLHDHFGQTTVLKLSGIVINGILPKGHFEFAIPQGADVLRDDNA